MVYQDIVGDNAKRDAEMLNEVYILYGRMNHKHLEQYLANRYNVEESYSAAIIAWYEDIKNDG